MVNVGSVCKPARRVEEKLTGIGKGRLSFRSIALFAEFPTAVAATYSMISILRIMSWVWCGEFCAAHRKALSVIAWFGMSLVSERRGSRGRDGPRRL